jgi:proteasome alpha subunit
MAAIEVASTEGFTRSAADVSLRRLAHYSLSPVMKAAFEQIYGPPYLARLLFAEAGEKPEEDLFLRVEYDGAIAADGGTLSQPRQDFAVLSGTRQSTELMESFLKSEHASESNLEDTLTTALDAWSVGHMALGADGVKELPEKAAIVKHRQEQLGMAGVEAAILERESKTAIRYRALLDKEVRSSIRA